VFFCGAAGLNYAPSGAGGADAAAAAAEASAAARAAAAAADAAAAGPPDEARGALREGRARLKENNGAAALVFFKARLCRSFVPIFCADTRAQAPPPPAQKALMLTRRSGDKCLERRAVRGLAVARRAQGDRAGAIADLQSVLEISKAMGEFTGDTDALGAIADLYTELGDLEKAGSFYDRYLAALKGETDSVD
jgi:hypothetical protein